MDIFIALVLLWLGCNQTCEHTETVKYVKMLGSDEYLEREKASSELKKLIEKDDEPIVGYIYWHSQNNKDLEVRRRCKRLYGPSVFVVSDSKRHPVPSIWALENKNRFPLGFKGEHKWNDNVNEYHWEAPFDISKHYFIKAREVEMRDNRDITTDVWVNPEIERLATKMLIADLRKAGWDRRRVEKLLNNMVEVQLSFTRFDAQNGWQDTNKVPKPFYEQDNTGDDDDD